ncbi:DUF2835 domain-containing protein [Marinimicrobium sp. ARAG 43.8]|uniref:DUF2835 domain-containing protein n=1 Tax=Marinimicrobium sp. ARAG 43.8 TaxID=3418719 RepID=UPI003CEF1F27
MSAVVVNISISPDEYRRWYEGSAQLVYAHSVDGRSVSFPAPILRPYVTRDGIRGRFRIEFDEQHRFSAITKID